MLSWLAVIGGAFLLAVVLRRWPAASVVFVVLGVAILSYMVFLILYGTK
jgi:hypothetical protein